MQSGRVLQPLSGRWQVLSISLGKPSAASAEAEMLPFLGPIRSLNHTFGGNADACRRAHQKAWTGVSVTDPAGAARRRRQPVSTHTEGANGPVYWAGLREPPLLTAQAALLPGKGDRAGPRAVPAAPREGEARHRPRELQCLRSGGKPASDQKSE